jgi:molybdenum cofactor cytidylyltransferase
VAVAAILLAAGESTRMGSPKPLLPWGDETLIEYDIRQLRDAGVNDLVAVVGHRAEDVAPIAEAAGARVVYNVRYPTGRATSLVAGASATPSVDCIIVVSVDQPRPTSVIRRLLDEQVGPVTLPTHHGQRGHPVALDGSLLEELRAVTDETFGLRAVVEREGRAIHKIEFESPVVLLDLNTPDDHARAMVAHFIDRINAGDIDGLAAFMSEEHALTVLTEPPVVGRAANTDAWRGYASSFPGYRIVAHETVIDGGVVSVLGHTTGSHLGLPDDEEARETLIWQARVVNGQVCTWTLIEDNPDIRRRLGFGTTEAHR